jgi:hypothetical protein
MTTPRPLVSDLVSQRLKRLNQEVLELRQAEESAALGAVGLTNNVQTANIQALLDMMQLLAAEIDQLRIETASA